MRERKQCEPGLEELKKKNATQGEGPGGQAAPPLCGPWGALVRDWGFVWTPGEALGVLR